MDKNNVILWVHQSSVWGSIDVMFNWNWFYHLYTTIKGEGVVLKRRDGMTSFRRTVLILRQFLDLKGTGRLPSLSLMNGIVIKMLHTVIEAKPTATLCDKLKGLIRFCCSDNLSDRSTEGIFYSHYVKLQVTPLIENVSLK